MNDICKPVEPVLSPDWLRERIKITEFRLRAANVSRAEICRKAGISAITWQRWRSGKNSPRIDNLYAIEEQVDIAVRAAFIEGTINVVAEKVKTKLPERLASETKYSDST